eukprot:TRINITY_DN14512_c0_g2_i1.p1 TRINITY_DN14512_c0_g2~~TRINITY_DN14512_c0_g2_i1.p1  ORF type:complete len:470 (+),score=106.08 TRINITY_DN14512_c0_g2_i1:108-1517(+)
MLRFVLALAAAAWPLGLSVSVQDALSLGLPRVRANTPEAVALATGNRWWARVGDHLYHAPDEQSPLSSDIDDYYVAVGSHAAVPKELRAQRVGGEGRFHIFYLPNADRRSTSMLELSSSSSSGSRRASLSRLHRLREGEHLSEKFPVYELSASYKNPLSSQGKEVERTVVNGISDASYKADLEKIVALGTRSYSNDTAESEAVAFVKRELTEMGLATCLQEFESQGSTQTNVVAYLPGKQSAGPIVVGAHYDSRPFSGPAPGAEDNGSGLAGLLAMARSAMAAKFKPLRPIYFVAFAAEEAGLWGSDSFAQLLAEGKDANELAACTGQTEAATSFLKRRLRRADESEKVHGAIIMDEIGWVTEDPNFGKQTVNLESRSTSDAIRDHMASVSQEYNGDSLEIIHSNNPFGSDHMSFLDRNIPAVLTINGDDEGYPSYHKSSDTIEKVTISYATKIVKMNAGAMVRMSGEV